MESVFVLCSPGLEPVVSRELALLGLAGRTAATGPGSVAFEGSMLDACRANLELRAADRVLVRLGGFRARAFPELRRKAGRLPWERFLRPGQPLAFKVTCDRSRLYHEGAVAERLAEAAAGRLGAPCPPRGQAVNPGSRPARLDAPAPRPAQLVAAWVLDNICTICADSSGEPLHRRGYRLETAKAPLKETLAAAMLMASGWDETSPLLDPFCGSGTIAIEAALLAAGLPPGGSRRFAFMDWPGFDSGAWERLKAGASPGAAPGATPRPAPLILASDRDAGAIRSARANAERAGAAGLIEFSCRPVSAISPPPGPGWVVTNPPFGVRLSSGRDLRDLYCRLGDVLRARCPGWRASVLCSGPALIGHARLGFETRMTAMNGGLRVRLAGCVVQGSSRAERAGPLIP